MEEALRAAEISSAAGQAEEMVPARDVQLRLPVRQRQTESGSGKRSRAGAADDLPVTGAIKAVLGATSPVGAGGFRANTLLTGIIEEFTLLVM